jgi:16S rRNA processing protein RimM
MTTRDTPSRIEIGGIARAHGIRGEVAIVTHDPASETLGEVEHVYVDGVPRRILASRHTHRGWLVLLEGVATRNEAEALRGRPVEVDRDDLHLSEGDILLQDLIGCAVKLVDGRPWGVVASVDSVPGGLQDRLVIHDGDVERMLPLVDQLVKDIDLEARVITVDPPEGLPESRL